MCFGSSEELMSPPVIVLKPRYPFCSLVFQELERPVVWCTHAYILAWIEIFCFFWPFLTWSLLCQICVHLLLLDSDSICLEHQSLCLKYDFTSLPQSVFVCIKWLDIVLFFDFFIQFAGMCHLIGILTPFTSRIVMERNKLITIIWCFSVPCFFSQFSLAFLVLSKGFFFPVLLRLLCLCVAFF